MAVTQNELITALQTLLSTTDVRLLMRTGTAAQLDLSSLVAGEFAVATDTQEVYCCFGNGIFRNLARGIVIKGVYATLGALQTAHPTGTEGDIYAAGSAPQHLYVWTNSAWTDMGAWNDTTLYAANASVVHNSGNESVGGNKTFTGITTFSQMQVFPNPAWTDINLTGTGWTGEVKYKKVAGVVYVWVYSLIRSTTAPGAIPIGVLPAGFRPALNVFSQSFAENAPTGSYFRSLPDGTLDVYSAVANLYYFHWFSFPAEQ